MLKLYNTLTRKEEEFKPLKDKEVGMYSCGPTVYWYAHIGAMRRYITDDVLLRALIMNGYKVKHIINVTDVGHLVADADVGEDKMELAAKKEGKRAEDIAKFYFDAFTKDLKKINFIFPDVFCWATKHIKEQIELIQKLEKKGYTYKTSDGIYYDTSKFKDYGKMARINKEEVKAGARIEMRDKKSPTDFALWKFSEEPGKRQQEWESPWGLGYPGWHIECSAMSMKYLGESFDIHTGGLDNMPVHHVNEIAQSEAATGKKFVNYWVHSAFVTSKGEKVSKSTGGLFTISELENIGYKPLTYRYFVLQTHYRKPLDFSLNNLDAAKVAYDRIIKKVLELKKEHYEGKDNTKKYIKEFENAVNDDLNTPQAIQILWKVLDDSEFDSKKKLLLLEKFDEVFGLGIKGMKEEKLELQDTIKSLVEQREQARKNKDWKEADKIRDKLKSWGFIVEDKPEGPKVTKIA